MNWEAIGAIGEVAGAAAVVLTLFYLSRQIRLSANVSKISSYHEAISQIVETVKDPEYGRLASKFANKEQISPEDKFKADVLSSMLIYSHEILLHLHQTEQVDEILWDNLMDNNQPFLESDMHLPVLRERRGRLGRDLLAIVEGRMNDA